MLAPRFVLFSWPSHGQALSYTRDESNLYWSVALLTKTLADMISRSGPGTVDVLAHSLGSRAVFLALTRLLSTEHNEKPLFDRIVLLAPDIDAGLFQQYLPDIVTLARSITVPSPSSLITACQTMHALQPNHNL